MRDAQLPIAGMSVAIGAARPVAMIYNIMHQLSL